MHLLQALSETALGRALITYFFDLPRWVLANVVFALALLPAYLVLNNGQLFAIAIATLPIVPVVACMIHMAANETAKIMPSLRDAVARPATLLTVFTVWAGTTIPLTLLLTGVSLTVVFVIGIVLFSLLMIGVFAIYMPSQLKVGGLLIWRNALVLAVSYPVVGLGLLALGGIGVWAVWISKGALIVVVPSLWVLLAAYTVKDRIVTMQAAQAG